MSKKRRSKYHKARSLAVFKIAVLSAFIFVLYFPQRNVNANEDNYFAITVDGQLIGHTDDVDNIYDCYREARKSISESSEDMVLIDFPSISYESKNVTFGVIDSKKDLTENFKNVMLSKSKTEYKSAYAVKVNETIVYLADISDVEAVLNGAIHKYDTKEKFSVSIESDMNRELSVLTVSVIGKEENVTENDTAYFESAGLERAMDFGENDIDKVEALSFDSFDLGVKDVYFKEPVEITRAHISEDQIMDVETASKVLTENQETQQIYKVQSGDTLSEISISVGLPLDEIIAMNDELENENSIIHVDQELIITVPKPELSVVWTELVRVDEAYELPIEYIYNDDWYTNQSVTHVQPSAGYHEAVLNVTNINDDTDSKETVYEEVKMEAVAKVVEVGTIVPPTYIKPLSGGRMSSTFGPRTAPKKGASTYHKGIDWATPVGTSVYASSGGTVAFAGWGSGYGNVVYINHPDGKQTRYGHLSKIYVKAGDVVKQGQVIAASGNTGVSTGPHVHFEILVNGVQVNPFSYMN